MPSLLLPLPNRSCRIGRCALVGLVVGASTGCQPATRLDPQKSPIVAKLPARVIELADAAREDRDEPGQRPLRAYTDWDLSETAADALGRIGAPAVPALIDALRESDPLRRIHAARVLARIGPRATEAIPVLIELLNDRDPLVRKAAARALGQIGPDALSAVPALMRVLQEAETDPNSGATDSVPRAPAAD